MDVINKRVMYKPEMDSRDGQTVDLYADAIPVVAEKESGVCLTVTGAGAGGFGDG